MCYGYYPVIKPSGGVDWLPRDDFFQLHREGRIVTREDGFHYAKDNIGVYVWRNKKVEVTIMRWDLIPRHFLQKEQLSLKDMVKQKNSRAKNSKGFSSYNARIETIETLFSFRMPWQEGLRMVTPASAFRERPNMDGAPKEWRGREYNVVLNGTYYLAGIWDLWENRVGEKMESCTIMTTDSMGNEKLRGIWHERCPIILEESQIEEWLDPITTPKRALEMCQLFSADKMEIEEVKKEPKNLEEKTHPPKNEDNDLFGGTI